MIVWQYYPKSDSAPNHVLDIVEVFKEHEAAIESSENNLKSNEVLAALRDGLEGIGFGVERGKKAEDKIIVPVLFGRSGKLEKYFEADAFNENTGTVLEVEAGRAVANYQFLKDLFQACMMHNVYYLAIAVRNTYKGSPDFERVNTFFDTLYASGRLNLPLKGVMVIGY